MAFVHNNFITQKHSALFQQTKHLGQSLLQLGQQGFAVHAVADAVVRCFASAFTDRAIEYRRQVGLPVDHIGLAVLVLVIGLVTQGNAHQRLGWLTLAGLLGAPQSPAIGPALFVRSGASSVAVRVDEMAGAVDYLDDLIDLANEA